MSGEGDREKDVWAEMLAIKASTLTEIGGGGCTNADLRNLTAWLQRELDLEARHKGLLAEAEKLVAERQNRPAGSQANTPPQNGCLDEQRHPAGKAGAKDFRE